MQMTLANEHLNELVAMPGFPGFSIRRTDLHQACIEAGDSAADADRAAFGYARRSDAPEMANARAFYVHTANGGAPTSFAA